MSHDQWEGPAYEYGVTWGPTRETAASHGGHRDPHLPKGKPMTETRVPEELVERALRLHEECRKGVEDRGVMPDYVDACAELRALAPKLLNHILLLETALTASGLQSDNDRLRARVAVLEGDLSRRNEQLARVVTNDVMHGSKKHGFVQGVAYLSLIPNEDQDEADYWLSVLRQLRTAAQRILRSAALDPGGDNMRGE